MDRARLLLVAVVATLVAAACGDETFDPMDPRLEGARLEIFHSDRYLPEVVPAILEQHGLQVEEGLVTGDREEGLWLCTPRPATPSKIGGA